MCGPGHRRHIPAQVLPHDRVDITVPGPGRCGVTFNLSELFEQVADAVPDREAVVTPGRRLTFGEIDARATRAAHVLADLGVEPGDHVGLQLMNGTEYLELMLGAYK